MFAQKLSRANSKEQMSLLSWANPYMRLRMVKGIFLGFGVTFFLTACSLDADIKTFAQIIDLENMNRKEPDFTHGEVVTTTGGHQFTGVFGEISEKTMAIDNNQWQFEGVFYE